ncbi:AraC family transcriptional regulator [Bacteroides graminisolvens]|uniref:AraC family transcriptional regulator n=1 Tax=Bacteroides graminisolvens TaxID=477666 RepID=UPI0003F51676|nr:AraC family transcriptional regulator [Bacteroides graminisolvens]
MLKEYTIKDICPALSKQVLNYVCPLEKIDQIGLAWPHKRNFYSITWFTEGNGTAIIDFAEYSIQPNRIFLTSPEQIHNRLYSNDAKGYVLMFDKAVAAQLGIAVHSPYIDLSCEKTPLLKLVIENMINKNVTSGIEIDLSYFYSLISEDIHEVETDHKEKSTLLSQFKELILSKNIKFQSMEQYANSLQVSLASLNDLCHKFAGSSAKQFLLELKIAEAKRLLVYSQLSVSTIAYHLGFEDPSYFSRIFKKKVILSPSVFLEKFRQ